MIRRIRAVFYEQTHTFVIFLQCLVAPVLPVSSNVPSQKSALTKVLFAMVRMTVVMTQTKTAVVPNVTAVNFNAMIDPVS